jgi:hypothetical protein
MSFRKADELLRAERDGTHITLSCVLFGIVVDSESDVQLLNLLSLNKYIVFL